jgi:hypothetical protein
VLHNLIIIAIIWSACSALALILLGVIDRGNSRSDDEFKLAVLLAGPFNFILLLIILVFGVPAVGLIEGRKAKILLKLAECYYNLGSGKNGDK